MAKRKPKRRAQRDGVLGPALRPVAWSALLTAAMATGLSTPAYAEPAAPTTVPDTGARPVPAGDLQIPGGITVTAPVGGTTLERLKAQITAAETEVAALGEQLKQLNLERAQLRSNLAMADSQWRAASDTLRQAQDKADAAAQDAYKKAAELPPGTLDSDLRTLGVLPWLNDGERSRSGQALARDLLQAQEVERAAYRTYLDAVAAEQALATRYLSLETTFHQREAALLQLRQRNANELAAVERAREADEQRLGVNYLGNDTVAGLQANPKAMAAVGYALRQRGKPYLWGAEGPDRYDCSGLTWAAYDSTGYTLPRVAKDQYYGTRAKQVSRYALLPGDLLFFSTSSTNWTAIHHVGMYIGNGKMVHAPTTGDVVKISTVWWSRFFAATRVYDAVPASSPAHTTPPPTPTPPTPPPPTTTPPTPPSPTPDPTRTAPPVVRRPPPGTTPPPTTTSPTPDPTTSATPDPTSPPPEPSSSTDTASSEPSTVSSEPSTLSETPSTGVTAA